MVKVYFETIRACGSYDFNGFSSRIESQGYIVTLQDLSASERSESEEYPFEGASKDSTTPGTYTWTETERKLEKSFATFSEAWQWVAMQGEIELQQVGCWIYDRRRRHVAGSISLPTFG